MALRTVHCGAGDHCNGTENSHICLLIVHGDLIKDHDEMQNS